MRSAQNDSYGKNNSTSTKLTQVPSFLHHTSFTAPMFGQRLHRAFEPVIEYVTQTVSNLQPGA